MSTPLRILYVDDDPDILAIVNLSLGLDPDVATRFASGGEEALDLVDAGQWRPDVILLDVMMPGMDGPTLMARLRERPALAAVPIIFMTARGRASDVSRYMEAGAAGVILKPFDPLTLTSQVRVLIDTP